MILDTSKYIPMNFHTHSTFCDGRDTLQANVEAAIQKGLKLLGFSSHALFPSSGECSIQPENYENYCRQVRTLKEKYADKIDIRLGFEGDFVPGFCRPDFEAFKKFNLDFLIGSVHFLNNGEKTIDEMVAVDNTPELLVEGLNKLYGGDIKKLVHHYFECQKEMLKTCSFSIIGHPDLVLKFNDRLHLIDENENWYKNELKEMAQAISSAGVIAEINTGAMSRGWRNIPYPSEYFLELLHEKHVPVMLNADAHAAVNLDFGFDLALALAKKAGYTELSWPEKGAIKHFKI